MATPSGGGGAGDGINRGGGAGDRIDRGGSSPMAPQQEGDFYGSSSPMEPQQVRIPAAAAMARAWKDSPAHMGRRFTGGVDLDDELVCEDFQNLYTQQSNNVQQKGKNVCEDLSLEDEEGSEEQDFTADFIFDQGEYMPEELDLSQRLVDLKRKREKSKKHLLNEEEDIFHNSDDEEDSDCRYIPWPDGEPGKYPHKKVKKNVGPADRSHYSTVSSLPPDFVPSDDDTLSEFDDDGAEVLSWVQPTRGRKSMAQKLKERKWYDENRLHPEDQLCLRMCFIDVYQFRKAVQNLHIKQLRNYKLHRNCRDRVIIKCNEKGCPFFMSASEIAGEKTFCLRKMNIQHTCPTQGENCKVTTKWVAKVSEQHLRIDPGTGVCTVMESTKEKYGVDVPKVMAYRARGEELKKYQDEAAYAYTKHDFDIGMQNLKEESEEAWIWMSKIPVECWARYAMDYNCKTDLIVNNLSEVFNKWILDVRGKPVKTMFEGIRTKIMTRHEIKRTAAASARWEICPTFAEVLEESKKYSRMYKAQKSVGNLWQVSRGVDICYAVDLTKKTCGCKKWDLSGIPCNHAVCAIYKSKQQPEDFVHDYFKKPMYLAAYNPVIFPVPGEDLWSRTDTPDIDPPVFRADPGRMQTKRRKGKFEVPAPKESSRMGSITCSNCKLVGHRYTNCGQPLTPQLQMRKNQHKANKSNEDVGSSATRPPPSTENATRPPPVVVASTRPPSASSTTATRPPPPSTPATAPAQSAPARARAGFIAPRSAVPGSSRPTRAIKPTRKIKEYLNASGIDQMSVKDLKKIM